MAYLRIAGPGERADYTAAARLLPIEKAGMARAPVVSIVIATHQRLERLKRCIAAIRRNVTSDYELVVVGGGTDGTTEWATARSDIRFIREERREGATRAYNKGFRVAAGRYVMWLNDDSYPLPGAVEAAINMIERPDLRDVGLVAFYHDEDRKWNRLHEVVHEGNTYRIYDVRGATYANFGLLRRSLLAHLEYLDERYYFCAWDPDLSLKVQREAGLLVIGCPGALIHHEELMDERKRQDMSIADADNAKLFRKWRLPEKFTYPDPGPAYQRLLEERGIRIPVGCAEAAPPARFAACGKTITR